MTTRQQQRQQERALVKQGEAAIAKGLPVTPQKSDVVAVTFLIARMLSDGREANRASRAAALAHALAEASTKRQPGEAKLACAKGCSYCCHTWVGATAPELIHLAHAIRAAAARGKSGLIGGIIDRAAPLRGLGPPQRFGAKLACPLLADGACTRYRDRPTMCRQATSLDLSACIEEYDGKGHGDEIKVSAIYLAHARNARVPLLAALALTRLPVHVYELSEGLARVLETEEAEARWLAGEDILAGVQRGPAEPPAAQQAISALVNELQPGLRHAQGG